MSTAASDKEDWLGTLADDTARSLAPSKSSFEMVDQELLRILTKAVEDLGLEWSVPAG